MSICLTDDGALELAGHDLGNHPVAAEYEYWVTVPAQDVPTVVNRRLQVPHPTPSESWPTSSSGSSESWLLAVRRVRRSER